MLVKINIDSYTGFKRFHPELPADNHVYGVVFLQKRVRYLRSMLSHVSWVKDESILIFETKLAFIQY